MRLGEGRNLPFICQLCKPWAGRMHAHTPVLCRRLCVSPCPPWPRSDLGCHIDGYIAQAAHSLVVASDPSAPVTGRAADAILCAQTCFDAAARLMRPGKKASEVAGPLNKIAEAYGCR